MSVASRTAARRAKQVEAENNLVLELAFLIEDPCGQTEIDLARSLVELGKAVPERGRADATRLFLHFANTLRCSTL